MGYILELCLLDFMAKRGYHQTGEVFSREIIANPIPVDINYPEGFLIDWWSAFYESFRSRFPEVALHAAESFDKVTQTVQNVVPNIGSVNQPDAPSHMGANITNEMSSSQMMLSRHLIGSSPVVPSSSPDLMDPEILDLLSSIGTKSVVPNLSPQRDLTSRLQLLQISNKDGMLPSASNSGYPMQQIPTVPLHWKARDDRYDIHMGRHMWMEASLCASANALGPQPEPSDAGNNRSLRQASHQGWQLVMLGDTNKITPESLTVDQQIIAPAEEIQQRKISGKQTTVQEPTNQLRLKSSNKGGIKRKFSSSSLAAVGEGDADSYLPQADASYYALKKRIATHTLAEGRGRVKKSWVEVIRLDMAHLQISEDMTLDMKVWGPRIRAEGISIKEIDSLHATQSKLLCCHFHSQGTLLAAAGHERKVVVWDLENSDVNVGEGHAHVITDIRFRPNSMVFATSSFDRTVMIWDAAKPSNPLQNLVGHAEHVMSTDFHSTNMDLLSSCDSNNEIRLWDVNRGDCRAILRGGSRQVRFQPHLGNLLASCTENIINIFDVKTNRIQRQILGHVRDIRSICWDMSGNYLASVSEDSARIWSVANGKCIHELCSGGNKFQSCIFSPGHGQVLVIGSYELLELWNPVTNKTWPYRAHDDIISSLADSTERGIIASVIHDQWIKIWK